MSKHSNILEMRNISKRFPGGVVANNDVTIEVRQGEVHCLLGENGAGKSVLMSILYGLHHASDGEIFLRGEKVKIASPKEARNLRIGMVHQHFMLVPTLTVAQNVILGQYPAGTVLNMIPEVSQKLVELGRRFKLPVDPGALVMDLTVGEQQRVEIIKALYHGADLLIFDEPTAVLTPKEIAGFLDFVRHLRDEGITSIFITHKLDEVIAVADRITVLRDARKIGTVLAAETDPSELARMMVGRDVLMKLGDVRHDVGEVVVKINGLSANNSRGLEALSDVSFDVRAGEIVGIAGVSGNGQSELCLALTGLLESTSGSIQIDGEEIARLLPRGVAEKGVAHVPEDRHKLGVILPFSISENMVIHQFRKEPFSKMGRLLKKNISEYSRALTTEYRVRMRDTEQPIGDLSGGNQQKVVVARELARNPRFAVINQLTRGVDIGAIEFLLKKILEARNKGTAILLVSTELEELFAVCDRILVMSGGRIAGEFDGGRENLEEIGMLMATDVAS
ncbi:MAG: ABC transporter ATP-binding protein [Rhodobacteraceae bacterium]|nr:ABC transporter ATP-binding protein [Paracoccaceae bacterium]